MKKTLLLAGAFLALGLQAAELPKTPFAVWKLDFSDDTPGRPPKLETKEALERSAANPWDGLPMRRISGADYITATRYVTVEKSASGLDGNVLALHFKDNEQPHWGPRVFLRVPHAVAKAAKVLTLSFDMARDNDGRVSGYSLEGICDVNFYESGDFKANRLVQLGRYSPKKPIHLEFTIDNDAKTLQVRVDNGAPVKLDWRNPKQGEFVGVRLDGLLTGSFAREVGVTAFDNIELTVTEWRAAR